MKDYFSGWGKHPGKQSMLQSFLKQGKTQFNNNRSQSKMKVSKHLKRTKTDLTTHQISHMDSND